MSTSEIVDTDGLAAVLQTTPRHIRELRYRNVIPAIKVGRLVRYDVAEVIAALRADGVAS